jgi:hypothetical protein
MRPCSLEPIALAGSGHDGLSRRQLACLALLLALTLPLLTASGLVLPLPAAVEWLATSLVPGGRDPELQAERPFRVPEPIVAPASTATPRQAVAHRASRAGPAPGLERRASPSGRLTRTPGPRSRPAGGGGAGPTRPADPPRPGSDDGASPTPTGPSADGLPPPVVTVPSVVPRVDPPVVPTADPPIDPPLIPPIETPGTVGEAVDTVTAVVVDTATNAGAPSEAVGAVEAAGEAASEAVAPVGGVPLP